MALVLILILVTIFAEIWRKYFKGDCNNSVDDELNLEGEDEDDDLDDDEHWEEEE